MSLRAGGVLTAAAREEIAASVRERFDGTPASAARAPRAGDPMADEVGADAAGWWRRLHAEGPVHWSDDWRCWLICGHDEVRRAARADDRLSSASGVMRIRGGTPMMLTLDRPDHDRLRRLVAKDFTARRMAAMEAVVRATAGPALDRMTAAGGGDIHSEVSVPVPIEVIAELLGVDPGGRGRFDKWSDRLVEGSAIGTPAGRRAGTVRVLGAAASMLRFFSDLIAERRSEPREDLLSALAGSHLEGELDDDELLWFAILLLVAGNETTRSLLTGLVAELARDPAQYALLRADRSLIPAAVEEGLRFVSPVRAFFRTASAPYRAGDFEVPEAGRVLLMWGAANRDPAVFGEPDRFDIRRRPAPHLAFGHGIHFCLGAHLARLEASVVLAELLDRVEHIELLGEPRLAPDPTLLSYESAPVKLVAARERAQSR
jgi:cytochrome P450